MNRGNDRDPGRGRPGGDPAGVNTTVLLREYRGGDRAALEELFRRYQDRVLRMVRVRLGRRLRWRMEVEDVANEALIEAFRSIDRYEEREDARFIDWVAKIVQRRIANLDRHEHAARRDLQREVRLDRQRGPSESRAIPEPAAEITSPSQRASRNEMREIVEDCLAELSETQREVILLKDYAGGDWSWIAEELGSPSTHAAEQLYQRARKALKGKVVRRLPAD